MIAPSLAAAVLSAVFAVEQPIGPRPVVPAPTPRSAPAAGGSEITRAPPDRSEPPRADPSPTPTPTQTIAGTVRQVETEPRRLVIDAAGGPVTVVVDRNTAVYLDSGTGTLRDVAPGAPVRVSVSGSDNRAFWVEVVRREAAPAAERPAMTRPAGTPAPPSSSGSDTGTGPAVPPVSPTLPPRAPPPSPPGPGPVPGGPVGTDVTTGTAPKQ